MGVVDGQRRKGGSGKGLRKAEKQEGQRGRARKAGGAGCGWGAARGWEERLGQGSGEAIRARAAWGKRSAQEETALDPPCIPWR